MSRPRKPEDVRRDSGGPEDRGPRGRHMTAPATAVSGPVAVDLRACGRTAPCGHRPGGHGRSSSRRTPAAGHVPSESMAAGGLSPRFTCRQKALTTCQAHTAVITQAAGDVPEIQQSMLSNLFFLSAIHILAIFLSLLALMPRTVSILLADPPAAGYPHQGGRAPSSPCFHSHLSLPIPPPRLPTPQHNSKQIT